MKNFILYNYEFERIHNTQPTLFDAVDERIDPEEAFKNKNEIFAKFLMDDYDQIKLDKRVRDKSKLIEFRTISKSKLCIHTHIIKPIDNICVLKICNEKKITHHTSDFNEVKMEDYPGCLVIIDNRNDIQRIAVETNKSVFSNEFTLGNILKSTFRRLLQKYSLEFRLTNVQNPRDFWSIVEDRINYKNGFRKVVFSLPPLNKERVFEKFIELTKAMRGSYKSGMETSFVSEQNGQINFSKKDDLQRELVEYSTIAVGGKNAITLYPNGHQKLIRVGTLSHENVYLDESVFEKLVQAQKEGNLFNNAALDKIKIEMKKGYKD